ncbi:MAG: AsmA family protein [Pseudomonadota bacterium]|nr:AsmA family protein [Pseudomonadota bacterium]
MKGLKYIAAAMAALLLLILMATASLDAGYFRQSLVRFIAKRAGRDIRVEGALQVHLTSLHPRLVAERVTIANPPWAPAGTEADIGRLSLVVQLPVFGHSWVIERLEMQSATLHLWRDGRGRANWQWTDPAKGGGKGLPQIRSLSMPDARVVLDDERRHLQFDGTVSARDVPAPGGSPALSIAGAGQLNGKTATFNITGDPLAAAGRDRPYHFTFSERGSETELAGRGALLRPFEFKSMDATFTASGADLKDLYFLTGVSLVNTGAYRLSGKLERRDLTSIFSNLEMKTGQSDLRGTLRVESTEEMPRMQAQFQSQLLRMADLGARAAGREKEAGPGQPLLLSTARLSPEAVRRGAALVNFRAQRLDVGRRSLHAVAARITIEHGVLAVAPLSAQLLGGQLSGHVRVDASTDTPTVDLDLGIGDAQLAQLEHKGAAKPAIEGLLRARMTVTGRGLSIHEVGASANGIITAVIPRGTMRASLAELAGIDLRGLSLLLAKKTQETAIRCGVASFQARDGVLSAQSLVLDTEPVLITGEGTIHLDSEALDLALTGHPKSLRLARLRSPLLVRGTLMRPVIGVQARNSIGQTAEAVALGVLLTPLAAILAFVDPGLAKDADCASLLAQAKAR